MRQQHKIWCCHSLGEEIFLKKSILWWWKINFDTFVPIFEVFAMPIREKTKRICCAIFGWEELVAFSLCIFATHLSIKIEGVCSILFVCFLGVLTSSNSFAAQRQLKGKCANGQRKQMNKKCFSFNGHWHGFSEGHFTFLTRPIGFYFLFVFG